MKNQIHIVDDDGFCGGMSDRLRMALYHQRLARIAFSGIDIHLDHNHVVLDRVNTWRLGDMQIAPCPDVHVISAVGESPLLPESLFEHKPAFTYKRGRYQPAASSPFSERKRATTGAFGSSHRMKR